MKILMRLMFRKILEAVTLTCRLKKDLQRLQDMLEIVYKQLVVSPEQRMKVDGSTELVTKLKKMSKSKDQDLSRSSLGLEEEEIIRVKVKYGGALLVNPGDAICQHGDEVEEGETDGGVAAEDDGGRVEERKSRVK